jgi:hypothetical protein
MIVSWPDAPSLEGRLKPPRPLVYLLGSYGESLKRFWYWNFARGIESNAGCVVYGQFSSGYKLSAEDFMNWQLFWLERADVIVFWMEDSEKPLLWNEFELGWILGMCQNHKLPIPLVGVHANLPDVKYALDATLAAFNYQNDIYTDVADIQRAAQEHCRSYRHERNPEIDKNNRAGS